MPEFYSNMNNVAPCIGDYVMIDVDALPKSTKGSARNRWIHIMEVQDGERVWKIIDSAVDKASGETFYFLRGARFQYKAEELILIGHADGGKPNVQEEEKET